MNILSVNQGIPTITQSCVDELVSQIKPCLLIYGVAEIRGVIHDELCIR